MQNKGIHLLFLLVIVIGVFGALAACSSPTPAPPPQPTAVPQPTKPTAPVATSAPPAADGAALAESRCTVCHNLDRVKRGGKNKDVWTTTVERMIGKGAKLTDAEKTVLIEYLTKTYP